LDTEDQDSGDDVEVILEATANGSQESVSKESKDSANVSVAPIKVRPFMIYFQNFPMFNDHPGVHCHPGGAYGC
jgi:hypothetical protein